MIVAEKAFVTPSRQLTSVDGRGLGPDDAFALTNPVIAVEDAPGATVATPACEGVADAGAPADKLSGS